MFWVYNLLNALTNYASLGYIKDHALMHSKLNRRKFIFVLFSA